MHTKSWAQCSSHSKSFLSLTTLLILSWDQWTLLESNGIFCGLLRMGIVWDCTPSSGCSPHSHRLLQTRVLGLLPGTFLSLLCTGGEQFQSWAGRKLSSFFTIPSASYLPLIRLGSLNLGIESWLWASPVVGASLPKASLVQGFTSPPPDRVQDSPRSTSIEIPQALVR